MPSDQPDLDAVVAEIMGHTDQDPGSNVNVLFEPMDSEIERMGAVIAKLKEKQATWVDMEGFRKEILERFGLAGFKTEVRVYTTNVEDMYFFEIDLIDRLEGEFDPDRQVHEVTHDLLGLGEGGTIPTPPEAREMIETGHTHAHGHDHHH